MMDTENDSPDPRAARAPRFAPGVAAALLAMVFALPVEAARLALVVGNDTYQRAPALRNARNDANSMEIELRAAGFAVTKVLDADRSALLRAKDEFAKRVKSDDDVVFFFSGHGSQPERYGAYLLPTDIAPTDERQITRDGLALEEVISDLKHARFSLIIIDACRDDPFRALSNKRSAIAGSQIAMGDPPRGTAVLLSASTGQQALDRLSNSDPVRNGLFTRELLKVMRTPGLDISNMLRKVRNEVESAAKRVNHEQRPSLRDETSGEFHFYRLAEKPPAESIDADQVACDAARANGGFAAWRAYLREYPAGTCAPDAWLVLGFTMFSQERRQTSAIEADGLVEARGILRVREKFGDLARVNIVSHNLLVLVTGEVSTEGARREIEGLLRQAMPTIRDVHNELTVGPRAGASSIEDDTRIATSIRVRMLDSDILAKSRVRVHVTAGSAYLMGIVSRNDAQAAAAIASTTAGVRRVVKIFEYRD